MIRELLVAKVKKSCLKDYILAHDYIWPELVEEYRKYGMSQISCFLYGRDLYIYLEYTERFARSKHLMLVDIRWQACMAELVENQENEFIAKGFYHFNAKEV